MTTGFVNTSSDMVRAVQNAIEAYDMGPLRALAQEPVQNSKDAKRGPEVHVEYRLHQRNSKHGGSYYLLTVTDYGTSGLIGPILTSAEREERGGVLVAGENWAAFEGQGFTKKGGNDALGSRGQGKSAFLYHSRPGNIGGDIPKRFLMLYDTLLESGEYRLGIRYAMPADRVKEPPLLGEEARTAVSSSDFDIGDGTSVSLGLEPLKETGTRVIMPFLSNEAVQAFRSGELYRWLQRLWWRAIQTGELQIGLTDEFGNAQNVEIPEWWRDESWKSPNEMVMSKPNISIGDGLVIKRIVLAYDPSLGDDEIEVDKPQYMGVQLLRSGQWIETFDVREWVPAEYRRGFRGFAEFERRLERGLKHAEKPQHESFNGQHGAVRKVRQEIGNCVQEFAQQQGWMVGTKPHNPSARDQENATEFLRAFAASKRETATAQGGPGDHADTIPVAQWKCTLSLDYPTQKSARVDWGQSIENISVTTQVDPPEGNRPATLTLQLTKDGGPSPVVVESREIEVMAGGLVEDFGDFQIIKGTGSTGKIQCQEPGVYQLRAVITHAGDRKAVAMRHIYMQCDPPPPPSQNPQTLSVTVQNVSREGEQRVRDGDEIAIQVTVSNRSTDDVTLQLGASFDDLLLEGSGPISLAGVPAGDVVVRQAAVYQRLRLYTSEPTDPSHPYLVLQPGRYYVRADLYSAGGESPVHSSKPVYFEVDPGGPQSDMPFELRAIENNGPYPMWALLNEPNDRWILQYPVHYPIYEGLPDQKKGGAKLSGRMAFIAEICASGLVEWALEPMGQADESLVEQLKANPPDRADMVAWESYCEHLDQLVRSYDSQRIENPREYDRRRRHVVADMLHIFEGLR